MSDEPPVVSFLDESPMYTTGLGAAYDGDSSELLGELPPNSIDLIVTSPPFALQHQKEYGNESLDEYNEWFMENFADQARRVLQPHGSFVVEIGGAFKRGMPERSTYQFELLTRLTDASDDAFDESDDSFHLSQDFYWSNPAKLPNPIEWVNVRKFRVTDAVTHIWWLAKEVNKEPALTTDLEQKLELIEHVVDTDISAEDKYRVSQAILEGTIRDDEENDYYTDPLQAFIHENLSGISEQIQDVVERSNKAPSVFKRRVLDAVEEGKCIPYPKPKPEANNQRVLQEYSESHKELIKTGEYNAGDRPSGWTIGEDSFANENEGAIPKNWIEASNTASLTKYQKLCREFEWAKKHPARFAREIPEFFIKFLTPNPPYDGWERGSLDRPIVLDIFAGSNLTGAVAEEEGRYWLAFEKDPEYLATSELRFLESQEARRKFGDLDNHPLEKFAENE